MSSTATGTLPLHLRRRIHEDYANLSLAYSRHEQWLTCLDCELSLLNPLDCF